MTIRMRPPTLRRGVGATLVLFVIGLSVIELITAQEATTASPPSSTNNSTSNETHAAAASEQQIQQIRVQQQQQFDQQIRDADGLAGQPLSPWDDLLLTTGSPTGDQAGGSGGFAWPQPRPGLRPVTRRPFRIPQRVPPDSVQVREDSDATTTPLPTTTDDLATSTITIPTRRPPFRQPGRFDPTRRPTGVLTPPLQDEPQQADGIPQAPGSQGLPPITRRPFRIPQRPQVVTPVAPWWEAPTEAPTQGIGDDNIVDVAGPGQAPGPRAQSGIAGRRPTGPKPERRFGDSQQDQPIFGILPGQIKGGAAPSPAAGARGGQRGAAPIIIQGPGGQPITLQPGQRLTTINGQPVIIEGQPVQASGIPASTSQTQGSPFGPSAGQQQQIQGGSLATGLPGAQQHQGTQVCYVLPPGAVPPSGQLTSTGQVQQVGQQPQVIYLTQAPPQYPQAGLPPQGIQAESPAITLQGQGQLPPGSSIRRLPQQPVITDDQLPPEYYAFDPTRAPPRAAGPARPRARQPSDFQVTESPDADLNTQSPFSFGDQPQQGRPGAGRRPFQIPPPGIRLPPEFWGPTSSQGIGGQPAGRADDIPGLTTQSPLLASGVKGGGGAAGAGSRGAQSGFGQAAGVPGARGQGGRALGRPGASPAGGVAGGVAPPQSPAIKGRAGPATGRFGPTTKSQQPSASSQSKRVADIMSDPGLNIRGKPVQFQTLMNLLERSGLAPLLQSSGPMTVFMPTDEAFAQLSDEELRNLQNDPEALRTTLLRHMTAFTLPPASLKNDAIIPSASGDPLIVNIVLDGKMVLVGGAPVVAATEADNGMIYVISKVLTNPSKEAKRPAKNVMEEIERRPDLSIFAKYTQKANLDRKLSSGQGPFTVFAPTNKAFAELSPITRKAIEINPQAIKSLLKNHILEGAHYSKELENLPSIPAPDGDSLRINATEGGPLVINEDIAVEEADISTGNGVIHVVDRLILPESLIVLLSPKRFGDGRPQSTQAVGSAGDQDIFKSIPGARNFTPDMPKTLKLARILGAGRFASWLEAGQPPIFNQTTKELRPLTVIVPTDEAIAKLPDKVQQLLETQPGRLRSVLNYHILPDIFDPNKLEDGTELITASGRPLFYNRYANDTILTLGGARILGAAQQDNVLVIAVDRVLYPPQGTIMDIVNRSQMLSELASLLRISGLDKDLSQPGASLTLFAPKNSGFQELQAGALDYLKSEPGAARAVLLRHLVRPVLFTSAFPMNATETPIENETGEKLALTRRPDQVLIDGIPLSFADITATNGVVHVIDSVL